MNHRSIGIWFKVTKKIKTLEWTDLRRYYMGWKGGQHSTNKISQGKRWSLKAIVERFLTKSSRNLREKTPEAAHFSGKFAD